MPSIKKILFLNYADNSQDDVVVCNNLSLHLSVLSDKVEAWSKQRFLGGDNKDQVIKENFDKAEAVIHLLSIHFENESQCKSLLESSLAANKKVIPILISSFDWESDPKLVYIKDKLLPENKEPIDSFKNNNEAFTQIVKFIRSEVFGDKVPDKPKSDRGFYYILAGIVFLAGCSLTYWVHSTFGQFSISILVFLMFCSIVLFVLRKILFPTNISSIH